MSLHIWYVSKLPYLGIVQLFTESIYALSSKSFSCPQIAFTCLYGRAFYTGLGTYEQKGPSLLLVVLAWICYSCFCFRLTDLQPWQLCGHFAPLPLFFPIDHLLFIFYSYSALFSMSLEEQVYHGKMTVLACLLCKCISNT